jgi:hypothetical protein
LLPPHLLAHPLGITNEGEKTEVSSKNHTLKPSDDAVYQQIYEQIRAKDDVSFKLLSLVPLISGAGISILVKTDTEWGLKCFVSGFGAIVTFSIFRWELRNIQWCDWYLERAGRMERTERLPETGLRVTRQTLVAFGKTEAEVVLYLAVILTWLLLPGVVALFRPEGSPGVLAGTLALVVGVTLGLFAFLGSRVDWKTSFTRHEPPRDGGLT